MTADAPDPDTATEADVGSESVFDPEFDAVSGLDHQFMDDDLTVLVIDDDRSLADLYTEWLERRYDVRTAYGGEQALQELDESVDLVLLDRRMPGASGDEVLETIRENDHDCLVVMVTAVKPDFDIVELGFDGYVTKPIDREELYGVVEQTLARATYEHQLREYYALTERKSAIEAAHDGDLEGHDEYAAIERRLEEVHDQIDDLLSGFEDVGFAAAIERTQTVATLRESEQRYRSMTEDVLDTSRVGTVVLDSTFRVVWANAAIERYFGLDRSDVFDHDYRHVVSERLAPIVDDGGEFEQRVLETLDDNTSVEAFQCYVPADEPREERWLRHWSKPIETGLYAGGRIEHYYDITALKEREQTLETLHEATRGLMDAETEQETAEVAVTMAEEMLEFPFAVLYLWDDTSGALRPAAYTAEMEDALDGLEAIRGGDNRIWQTFIGNDVNTTSDREESLSPKPEPDGGSAVAVPTPFQSELLLPLDNHGVLLIGDPDPGAFSDADITFANILAANTAVALERAERERKLRERDQQLEQQNDQLKRLNRINTVIRDIGEALVSASSREEIERTVCNRLANIDSYSFVWIGEPSLVSHEITPRARAGNDQGYLESITLPTNGTSSSDDPAQTAIQARESQVIQNILEDPAFERWRNEALNRGYRSLVSIPVVYERSVYGILEIYADRPFAFDEEEQAVLTELGEIIGHAINAVKRKEALLTDSVVELEFELPNAGGFFVRLAEEAGGRVDLRTAIPQSDETYIVFFTVEDTSSERALEVAKGFAGVDDVTLVRERSESAPPLFKCRIDSPDIITTVTEHGAIPQSVTANSDGSSVMVTLPQTTDVRAFNEVLTSAYSEAELIARREHARSSDGSQTLYERLDERLTDRQREVLQAAYFGGYFDWPRESNGETLAGMLDISQPTFQQHLRAGERKLFEALFETL